MATGLAFPNAIPCPIAGARSPDLCSSLLPFEERPASSPHRTDVISAGKRTRRLVPKELVQLFEATHLGGGMGCAIPS